MMDDYGAGMGWAGWLMMGSGFLLFWAVVLAVALCAVHSLRSREPAGGARLSGRAGELLAERFARGEIDEQEFARRRDLLGGSTH